MSTPETDSLPRLVQRRQNFDQATVNAAVEEALAALGKAKMKMPLNLAHELQHAHDHLLNARDWLRLYSLNNETTKP